MRKNTVFSRIDHFRSPKTLFFGVWLKKSGFSKNEKITIFLCFLWKRTRIDLQGPMVLERHQDVKTRHLVCICVEESNIWHLYTFDSLSSLIRQNENLKFLKKSAFFNEENTNVLALMLKSDKIHFFSIWAVTTSFWATKVIDTWKNWIFSQFSDLLILVDFDHFWPSFEWETWSDDLKIRKKLRIQPT